MGTLITISGPSGTGKTTTTKFLTSTWPNEFQEVISYTTRSPRPGETHGKTYFYVSKEEFARMFAADEFVETVSYNGTQYGVRRRDIEEVLDTGVNPVLICEPKGAVQIYQACVKMTRLAQFYLLPPETEEKTRGRMLAQGRSPEDVEKRLSHDRSYFPSPYTYFSGWSDLIPDMNIGEIADRIRQFISKPVITAGKC